MGKTSYGSTLRGDNKISIKGEIKVEDDNKGKNIKNE